MKHSQTNKKYYHIRLMFWAKIFILRFQKQWRVLTEQSTK